MRVRSINNDPAVNRSFVFMPQINEIGVRAIPPPIVLSDQIPASVLPAALPPGVTQLPVIEMPGCVKARIGNGQGVEVFEDDPKGNVVLCEGGVPVFEAPDYRPNDFTYIKPELPKIKEPEVSTPAQNAVPLPKPGDKSDIPRLPKDPPCPPFGAQEIASFNKLGTKVLAGYELQDGKCVKIWDPVPVGQVINNYVPDAGPTVSIGLTAAFATTVAIFAKPIASVLQKLAKPLTKKVVKKISQKLGRRVKQESLQERRAVQRYRNQAIRDLRRALGK
jgi:hypothetical protein